MLAAVHEAGRPGQGPPANLFAIHRSSEYLFPIAQQGVIEVEQEICRVLIGLEAAGIAKVVAFPSAARESDDADSEFAGGLGVVGSIAERDSPISGRSDSFERRG